MESTGHFLRRLRLAAAGLSLVGMCSCTAIEPSGGHASKTTAGLAVSGNAQLSGSPAVATAMSAGGPSREQSGGQWTPPGIKGPWPADEYLSDGGDRGLPARPGHPGEILDLDGQDTVALFEDTAGQTHVVPSNEVDIYAPRFGAVRSVSTLSGYKTSAGTGQFATSTNLEQIARLSGPKSFVEDVTAIGMQSSQRASNYDADLTVSQVTKETILEGVIGTQLAAEQPGLVESATLEQEQGVEHTRGTKQATVWSHDKSAQAVVETRGGNEVVVSSGAQETVAYGKPGGPPGTIQIVKSASHSTAQIGDVIDFTIRFRNGGTTTVEKVSLLDNLTPRLGYVPGSATSDLPASFTAAISAGGNVVLRWDLKAPLEAGEEGAVRFQVRVN